MRRKGTIIAALAGAALLAGRARTATSEAFTLSGTVTRVVDGDTAHVLLAGGRNERVRLIGIDTPGRPLRRRSRDRFGATARRRPRRPARG